MGYRDQVIAAEAKVEAVEAALRRELTRAEAAEARVAELEAKIDTIERGASWEQTLRDDVHFAVAQVLMPITGALGILSATAVYWHWARDLFYGGFDPTPRGVAYFLRQLDAESFPVVALFFALSILAALPWLAALGLLRRRKWGWILGMLTWAGWAFAFPPFGLYGLFALGRSRVRECFFPTWRGVLDEGADS